MNTKVIYEFMKQHINTLKENNKGNKSGETISIIEDLDKKLQDEINDLEKNTEYDKFVIACYGETNAGKSTIIEMLRIYFQETQKKQEQQRFNIILQEYQTIQDNMRQIDAELQNIQISLENITQKQEYDLKELQVIDDEILKIKENETQDKGILFRIKRFFGFNKYEKEITKKQKEKSKLQEEYIKKIKEKQEALEKKRAEISANKKIDELFNNAKNNCDGNIIGDGSPDFTRVVNQYDLENDKCSFAILDVPGIEGKEEEVGEEILKATKKAHCVFYITGKETPPQQGDNENQGTIAKIKKHLNAQTEVYTIFNKKVNHPRALRISDAEEKSLKVLDEKMQEILGDNYIGRKNIIAQAGFYAKATCLMPDSINMENQAKFLNKFSRDELFERSFCANFVNFLENDLISNSKEKISKAIFNKAITLLDDFNSLVYKCQKASWDMYKDLQIDYEKLGDEINNELETHDFNSKNILDKCIRDSISNIRIRTYENIESDISNDAFKDYLKSNIKEELENFKVKLEEEFSNEANRLKQEMYESFKRFERRVKNQIAKFNISLDELQNFNFSIDIDSGVNWGGLVGTALGVGALMWWNPVGWIALSLSIFGLFIGAIKSIWGAFDKDYKKSQQRKEVNSVLNRLSEHIKKEAIPSIEDQTTKIKENIEKEILIIEEKVVLKAKANYLAIKQVKDDTLSLKIELQQYYLKG